MEMHELCNKISNTYQGIEEIKCFASLNQIVIFFEKEREPHVYDEIEAMAEENGYRAIFDVHRLNPQEVLDKILYSDDFEEVLMELLDLKHQNSYKINMTNCGLDIDIFDIKIDSQLFKALKKSELRFNLHGKNTLNIKR